jgi:hypothetical protein
VKLAGVLELQRKAVSGKHGRERKERKTHNILLQPFRNDVPIKICRIESHFLCTSESMSVR